MNGLYVLSARWVPARTHRDRGEADRQSPYHQAATADLRARQRSPLRQEQDRL